jgi:hypothetical protein
MFELAGAGVGLLGGIYNLFRAGQEKRKLEQVLKNMPESQAAKMAGLATTQLQGRAPGSAEAERGIFQSGATAMGRTTQAAKSSADVLQQSANIQAQTNQALQNLGLSDIQDYQRRYANYSQALQNKAEDDMRRYQMETQIRGAQEETMRNAIMNLQDVGMGVAYLGSKGAFSGLKGKGNTGVDFSQAASNMAKMGMPQIQKGYSGTVSGAYNPIAASNMSQIGYPTIFKGQTGLMPNANNPYYYQQQALMYPQQYPGGYE